MEASALLHKNLSLLSQFHKPPKEFLKVFKEDMFSLTNRDGMVNTLYFLLPILKPDVFEQDIRWPIYTKEDEAAFRRAVLKFLTDHSSKFESLKLPKIATSILSTAGGPKFVNFMLDLSTTALSVTLRKRNKEEYDRYLGGFTSLDKQEQLSRYNDLRQKADQGAAEFKTKEEELESTIRENGDEADKLKSENDQLTDVLIIAINETNCIKESDKKSFTDLETRDLVVKRLKELKIRENVAKVRVEEVNKFADKIHELAMIVKAIKDSKTQDTKLDGSAYTLEYLTPYISRLSSKGLLKPDCDFFVNGKITLAGLSELCACSCADLLDLAQEKFGKKENPAPEKTVELYEWSLRETNALKKEMLEVEAEQRAYLAQLDSSIEQSNAIIATLLNFAPHPRFACLLAPSPQVTMSPESDSEDSEAEYDSPMDSPYVQNYAKKLLEKVKANATAAKSALGHGNQTPTSSLKRHNSSEGLIAQFKSIRITKPGTYRTKFDDFLDQSFAKNRAGSSSSPKEMHLNGIAAAESESAAGSSSSPKEMPLNEVAAAKSEPSAACSSFDRTSYLRTTRKTSLENLIKKHMNSSSPKEMPPNEVAVAESVPSPACSSFEGTSSLQTARRTSLEKLIDKYKNLKSKIESVKESEEE